MVKFLLATAVTAVFLLMNCADAARADEKPSASGADAPEAAAVAPAAVDRPVVKWLNDYRLGTDRAKAEKKMLFLWFFHRGHDAADTKFEKHVLEAPAVQKQLAIHVSVAIPVDATTTSNGQTTRLLDHPAFSEMLNRPGIAMVDHRDPSSPHYGRVVSVFPFDRRYPSVKDITVLLDLPAGSLTQRTLMFAVRTHPERPASAWSQPSPLLAEETEAHSTHQAQIHVQGHHNWDQRFHRINRRLPRGLVANEVCAESWPGQPLMLAAEECVDCWRQSPGHWDHVRRRHALFGFDMKRGRNGIWYATGIFAGRR